MNKNTVTPGVRAPILAVVVGRQRVGKTAVINTIIQKVREAGGDMHIWNADKNNLTHNLGVFHSDVLAPPTSNAEEAQTWLEARIEDQTIKGYDAILDVGGGDTPFTKLVRELPIIASLASDGIRVVAVHVVGPDQADVDYLQGFVSSGDLKAESTLIVLNAGLILSGKTAGVAFAEIMTHPAILSAIKTGARVATFPRLTCMAAVTDRRLGFRDAATNGDTPGCEPMLKYDRLRTRLWFDVAVPDFMADIPPLWLPAMSKPLVPAEDDAQPLDFAAE